MKDEAAKRGLIDIEGPTLTLKKQIEPRFRSNGYVQGKLMRKATAQFNDQRLSKLKPKAATIKKATVPVPFGLPRVSVEPESALLGVRTVDDDDEVELPIIAASSSNAKDSMPGWSRKSENPFAKKTVLTTEPLAPIEEAPTPGLGDRSASSRRPYAVGKHDPMNRHSHAHDKSLNASRTQRFRALNQSLRRRTATENKFDI